MYIVTARRMTSGLVLNYRKGERFIIRRTYSGAPPVSTNFLLTKPPKANRAVRSAADRPIDWRLECGNSGRVEEDLVDQLVQGVFIDLSIIGLGCLFGSEFPGTIRIE